MMASDNPYRPPRSPLKDSWEDTVDSRVIRRRSGMGWPFGIAALIGWMFPGGFMVTWAVFALAVRAVFWLKDRDAILTFILSGIGLLAYFLCLRF